MSLVRKILVCIYTCNPDQEHLDSLESTKFYKNLLESPSIQVFRIYAGADTFAIKQDLNSIYLPCEESYEKLSLKTFNMIKYSLQFKYDFLVKVDSTLASYRSVKHSKSEALLQKLSPQRASEIFVDPHFFCVPYNGLVMQSASKDGVENWAKQKQLSCSFDKVFSDSQSTPPYYLGKLYSLRRDFCEYIAAEGMDMAWEHVRYLGGAEDLMIGRLYERWLQFKSISRN